MTIARHDLCNLPLKTTEKDEEVKAVLAAALSEPGDISPSGEEQRRALGASLGNEEVFT